MSVFSQNHDMQAPTQKQDLLVPSQNHDMSLLPMHIRDILVPQSMNHNASSSSSLVVQKPNALPPAKMKTLVPTKSQEQADALVIVINDTKTRVLPNGWTVFYGVSFCEQNMNF